MAWRQYSPNLGAPKLDAIHTAGYVKQWKLGDIWKGIDPVYGVGEFIYLKGVASNFAGALVTYVDTTGVVALSTTSLELNGGAPLAVSMSAAGASDFGWYQVAGDAIIKKTAVKYNPTLGTKVYLSGTAGRVMQTSVAGRQIIGARFAATATVTSTTSTVVITLNRPSQKTGSVA